MAEIGRPKRKFRKFGRRKKRVVPAEPLDYKNVEYLQTLISPQGKMFSRKRTAFSGIDQKKFKLAVKRARFLGLLPYVG